MDSAKRSVEKVLEIAKKHGYACVVGFRKPGGSDMYGGMAGDVKEIGALFADCLDPQLDLYVGDCDGE